MCAYKPRLCQPQNEACSESSHFPFACTSSGPKSMKLCSSFSMFAMSIVAIKLRWPSVSPSVTSTSSNWCQRAVHNCRGTTKDKFPEAILTACSWMHPGHPHLKRQFQVEVLLVGIVSACVADFLQVILLVLRQRTGWVSWVSWTAPVVQFQGYIGVPWLFGHVHDVHLCSNMFNICM